MVEFALVAPLGFLLLMGMVVGGILVFNQVQLTNAARDAARGAAICGSSVASAPTPGYNQLGEAAYLPDGTQCTNSNVTAFVNKQLRNVNAGYLLNSISVYQPGTSSPLGSGVGSCGSGLYVGVSASYNQPLYLPLIGRLLGDGGGNSRQLSSTAQATCEQ